MTRTRILEGNEISQDVQKVLDEIEGAFGMVPNLFRSYAHFPPLLEANWTKVKAVMMQGSLSRKLKETIAVLVSKDNACQYCVNAHNGMLKAIGILDQEIATINENPDAADFIDKEKALLNFVRKANLQPHKIRNDEFANLRELGATDAEIVEALGTMETFTAFNKYIDAIQLAIDF